MALGSSIYFIYLKRVETLGNNCERTSGTEGIEGGGRDIVHVSTVWTRTPEKWVHIEFLLGTISMKLNTGGKTLSKLLVIKCHVLCMCF